MRLSVSSAFLAAFFLVAQTSAFASTPSKAGELIQKAKILRQTLRNTGLQLGQKIRRQENGKAEGSVSGGAILGTGLIDGQFSQQTYDNIINGGEMFSVRVLGTNTRSFVAEAEAFEKKGDVFDACTFAVFSYLRYILPDTRAFDSNVSALRATLDQLELEDRTPTEQKDYEGLQAWATNSGLVMDYVDFDSDAETYGWDTTPIAPKENTYFASKQFRVTT